MNQKLKSDKKIILEKIISITLLSVIVLFFALIVYINFLQNPNFYCGDMYSDMCYSQEVWEHKSIFPEGWVFGNQFYAVATPVVASIFFGITKNHTLAMAITSTLMSLGILISFAWMLKPMCKKRYSCFAGLVILLALPLFFVDPIQDFAGWQFLYTMCSYYSCYAITAFLGFGCYLRFHSKVSLTTKIMLIVALILSFGCGIQSLRQTVIMILPLLALEFFSIIIRLKNKQKVFCSETFVVISLTITNVIGLIIIRLLSVPRHEVFGKLQLKPISEIFSAIIPSVNEILSLIRLDFRLLVVIGFAVITATVILLIRYKKDSNMELKCILLFVFAIVFVLLIAILTTMTIRNIYYFMIYPLVSFLVFFIFEKSNVKFCIALTSITLCFSIICGVFGVKTISLHNKAPVPTATCKYLSEHDIDTIYAIWNFGGKVSIESNWEIAVGLWHWRSTTFEEIDYLCDPDIFNSDPRHSAYLFNDKDDVLVAKKKAKEMGAELKLMKYIEKDKIWIYTSPVNLMHKAEKN